MVDDVEAESPVSRRAQKKRDAMEKFMSQQQPSRPPVRIPSRSKPQGQEKGGLLRWWPQILLAILVCFLIMQLKWHEESYHRQLSHAKQLEMDPYHELGVPRTASRTDIRKAHRSLSLEWHPDRRKDCDEACHQRFNRISQAFKVLNNPEKRKMYDETTRIYSSDSTTKFTHDMQPFEFVLSEESWRRIVQPSLHGMQLLMDDHISGAWAVVVSDPTSEWTEHFLGMWSDFATRFYGRVSFLRVDSRDPIHEKLLPVRLAVTPAVMLLSPDDPPAMYSNFRNFTPQRLSEWITENMQNEITEYTGDLEALGSQLLNDERGSRGKIRVALVTRAPINSVLKAMALRYSSIYEFYHVKRDPNEVKSTLAKDKIEGFNSSAAAYLIAPKHGNGIQGIPLPKGILTLDQMRFKQNENVDDMSNTQAGKAKRIIDAAMRKIASNVPAVAYSENIEWLCENQCVMKSPENPDFFTTDKRTVVFPLSRLFASGSPLYKHFSTDNTTLATIDITEKVFTIKQEKTPWTEADELLPQQRYRPWEKLVIWCSEHNILVLTLVTMTYATHLGLKYLLAWKAQKAKSE